MHTYIHTYYIHTYKHTYIHIHTYKHTYIQTYITIVKGDEFHSKRNAKSSVKMIREITLPIVVISHSTTPKAHLSWGKKKTSVINNCQNVEKFRRQSVDLHVILCSKHLAVKSFRCQPFDRNHSICPTSIKTGVCVTRQTKICHFKSSSFSNQNVTGSQVSVDQVFAG